MLWLLLPLPPPPPPDPRPPLPPPLPQVLVVGGDQDGSEAVGEAATGETRDGVTPVMRNARERIFRRPIDVPPHVRGGARGGGGGGGGVPQHQPA